MYRRAEFCRAPCNAISRPKKCVTAQTKLLRRGGTPTLTTELAQMKRLFVSMSIAIAVLALRANAQPAGTLDTSFNGSGYIEALLVTGADTDDLASSMVLQADGKIVVAGTCSGGDDARHLCLARLAPDGTLDPSFDGPGPNGSGVGSGRGKFVLDLYPGVTYVAEESARLALQADGKIVVGASCSSAGARRFCMARLLENGSFDTSFNGPSADGLGEGQGAGRFVLPRIGDVQFDDQISSVLVYPSGRIVAAGACGTLASGANYQFCLARLNANGSFDRSFVGANNAQGRFVVSSLSGSVRSHAEYLNTATLQNDGKLLIAGYCDNNDATVRSMCVARLLDDGRFDTTFGEALSGGTRRGAATYVGAIANTAASLALHPDGGILLAGTCSPSIGSSDIEDMCVARITKQGDPDPLFAYPYAPVTAVRALSPAISDDHSRMSKVLLQADARWVATGTCNSPGFNARLCFARYSADGIELDRTFAAGGALPPDKTKLQVPGTESAQLVAASLQPNGKVLLLGTCSYGGALLPLAPKFCLARVHGGAPAGRECSFDIDGDGRVSALTDGLINTRIALGLTGDAVTNGVRFAANAQRSNWSSIRNYLVSQCEASLP
jgi:uncharacterized delta-60 repeat protein